MTTTPGVRIRRLRLTNYRSVGSCDLVLGDLAVLVGPNGAGKSNILDALVFLKDALTMNLRRAVYRRGADQIALRGSEQLVHGDTRVGRVTAEDSNAGGISENPNTSLVTVAVHVAGLPDGRSCEYSMSFSVRLNDMDPEVTVRSETCSVCSENDEVCSSFDRSSGVTEIGGNRVPVPATEGSSLVLGVLTAYEAFAPVHRALTSTALISPHPDAVHYTEAPASGGELQADAGNLAAVLLWLEKHMPEAKERIDEYLSLIVPGIRRAVPRDLGGVFTLEFDREAREPGEMFLLRAVTMSDGTLRALGILTALFAPSGDGTFGPVIIEEPETALHPAAAGVLFDAIREASTMRQVLVTTHSGDLLDAGDLGFSEIFAVRSEAGSTKVGPLDAGGRLALEESLFSAGELLRSDQLQPAPDTQP